MTTCPNNKHGYGCRMMEHPDDHDHWYCPRCGKKLIEDPGYSFIIFIVGMVIALVVVLNILPKTSSNTQNTNQKSAQTRLNNSSNSFGYEKSMNQVSPIE